VEDIMDAKSGVPLTDAEVRRYHHRRFVIALIAFAYSLGVLVTMLAFAIASAVQSGIEAGGVFAVAAVGALATYLGQVTVRRWRRCAGARA
jgi:VIT1/CCC1 family predicted Fe2+/Mn2+ transporter